MNFSLDPCPDCATCDWCQATYCRHDHGTRCPYCAEDETRLREAIADDDSDPDYTWSAA